MPGTKRAAESSAEPTSSRSSKSAKVDKPKNGNTTKATSAKPLKPPTVAQFKATALPLHVSISHTPPSIKTGTTTHNETTNTDTPNQSNSKPDSTDTVLPLGASPSPSSSESSATSDTTAGDSGHIGVLTLVPSTFSTGSYGWKGSKRIVVELLGGEEGENGEREKVQVMLSINATVLGSKPSKGKKADNGIEVSCETPEVDESQGEEADVSSEAV